MTASVARQIALAARPQGKPRLTDFRLEETEIPTPGPGQLLLEVQYLSLDPYMRGRMDDRKSYATPVRLGDVMTGESVARVLASNHPGYAEGDIVVAATGWRTHALSDGIGLYIPGSTAATPYETRRAAGPRPRRSAKSSSARITAAARLLRPGALPAVIAIASAAARALRSRSKSSPRVEI
jgi:NADPH:quinone reductase-like Zn-dependent oxidoreductase